MICLLYKVLTMICLLYKVPTMSWKLNKCSLYELITLFIKCPQWVGTYPKFLSRTLKDSVARFYTPIFCLKHLMSRLKQFGKIFSRVIKIRVIFRDTETIGLWPNKNSTKLSVSLDLNIKLPFKPCELRIAQTVPYISPLFILGIDLKTID